MSRVKKQKAEKNKYHRTFKKFKYTVMLYMIIPVIILCVFIITNYWKGLNSELQQRRDIAHQQIVSDIKTQFSDIPRFNLQLKNDSRAHAFFWLDDLTYENSEESNQIHSSINSMRNMYEVSEYPSNIGVYSLYSGEVVMFDRDACSPIRIGSKWHERYKETGETEQLLHDGNYIVVTEPFQLYGETVGIMIFVYNDVEFRKLLNVDRYGCDVSVKLSSAFEDEVFKVGDVNPIKTLNEDMLICNGRLTIEIGDKDDNDISQSVFVYSIWCILSCLLLAYIVATISAKFLYNGVKDVFTKMGTNEEPFLKLASQNGYIDNDSGKDAEEKLAVLLNKMQSMQLTSLQQQINPHFVFNVLNYVNLEVMKDDKSGEKVSSIVALLSEILGYAMSEPKYSSYVYDEIKMTKKYLEIEDIRLGGEFDVEWNVDKHILEEECIKLFLQPIVENAIMHGIKKLKDKRGRLEITVTPETEGICFVVKDNGVGMTPERLKIVRERINESYNNESSKHIGLRNVNERIKMIYGKKYGVTIDSDENGTIVTIRIGGGYNKVND